MPGLWMGAEAPGAPAPPVHDICGDTGRYTGRYTGRFAPSPTGPLHAGSLVAALASWLDARAHGGRWLVRVEDVDGPRCPPGTAEFILGQLAALGLVPDETPIWQSQRGAAYAEALARLQASGCAYACVCSRRQIELAARATGWVPARGQETPYPRTCRTLPFGRPAARASPARAAWRYAVPPGADAVVAWCDRRLGPQQQDVAATLGDFVLRRSDALWAYQLAVVVDDAAQGISHVVRGEDLAEHTARQILLQRALGYTTPAYWHTPLVLAADGQKLSKQTGAAALQTQQPLAALQAAGHTLGLPTLAASSGSGWLLQATQAWACHAPVTPI
jgi:glutamyl-Q tRNA(Asp) synthetase